MVKINDSYLNLKAGYLFPEIARRVNAFQSEHPDADVIKMGIGDVTLPLPPAVTEAMHQAVDEMAQQSTFRGYGPEQGYEFLRKKVAEHDYRARGCDIDPDEIFVSDGSKCDTANILDILANGRTGNRIAVVDPVYPVYVDTNVMAGNAGAPDASGRYTGLTYLPATEANGFVPALPADPVDVIYLCFPNNPTGAVADKQTLAQWVAYAKQHHSLILFDAAYEAYITDPAIPHSIYEIEGAKEVAIEFRSFSKGAGFTGTRCAITVVPQELMGHAPDGRAVSLHKLWSRRHTTKFNGVAYVVQRGAEAVYSEAGQKQVSEQIDFYLQNAKILGQTLAELDITTYGGINAPYIWVRTPEGVDSWTFFDQMLQQAHLVGTPGSGFGAGGEGFFRLSAFNTRENVEEAARRLRKGFSPVGAAG